MKSYVYYITVHFLKVMHFLYKFLIFNRSFLTTEINVMDHGDASALRKVIYEEEL